MKKLFLYFFITLICLSGAAALIFETAAQKMMVLVFGASALGSTSILASIFFGFGCGSLIGSRFINQKSNLLKLYLITLALAAFSISLIPFILKFSNALQILIFHDFTFNHFLTFAIQFILSLMVVLPATFCIGMTIPTINQIVCNYFDSIGKSISVAYGFNTFGAVIGCFLTAAYLIPKIGIQNTLYSSAILYLLIGLAFLTIRNRLTNTNSLMSDKKPLISLNRSYSLRTISIIYFACSFISLSFEILWLRILGIYNTNSILTFASVISVFLLGVSIGSLLFYPILAKKINDEKILLVGVLGAALAVLSLIPLYYLIPKINWFLINKISMERGYVSLFMVLKSELIGSFIVTFLPTIFLGLIFPSCCALTTNNRAALGKYSGYLYFIGSIGSACGVFLTGLIIIPTINLVGSLGLLVALTIILSLIIFNLFFNDTTPFKKLVFITIYSVLFILSSIYLVKGLPFLKPYAIVKKLKKQYVMSNTINLNKKDTNVLKMYKAGPSATVSVQEYYINPDGVLRDIAIDGQKVATTQLGGMIDAKMLAHIPLLVHPNPKNAITVGFGSGGTSWSMSLYDKVEVECVEIEPQVINAAYLFYKSNHGIVNKPNYKIIIDDARHHFLTTTKYYDVISTDVTNLAYKNNSSLYTKEYFELLKRRLNKGGVVAAWVPILGKNNFETKVVAKTFQSVFPHTTVWFFKNNYIILLGTEDKLKIDYQILTSKLNDPKIKADLKELSIPGELINIISTMVMDEYALREFTKDVPINIDNYPILEFYSTTTFFQNDIDTNELFKYYPKNRLEILNNLSEEDKEKISQLLIKYF